MTARAVSVPHSGAEQLAAKIPLLDRIQALAYSLIAGQWAVGFWSGVYVLVFQAHWFGKSFKYTWDHLNTLWHFRAIPGIGDWLFAHYDIGRHIFLRDAPEAILAYAVVAMIITFLASKEKAKTPWLDRLFVRLHIPSIYQGRYEVRHGRKKGQPRRADTSPLQFTFLLPSMLATAIPGEAIIGAIIFGGIAIAHSRGYNSPWLLPTSPWVAPVIGIAGGRFAGHRPAVKAGADIQRYFGTRRLAVPYAADAILDGFALWVRDGNAPGAISKETARNELTGMRRADPSLWYPVTYRRLYARLLAAHAAVRQYSKASKWVFGAGLVLALVIGLWGVYLRKWGIAHGFWLPW
jgi:hypothetical protein